MTFIVDPNTCILCGACESECPEKAISEKNGAMWIDPAKCKDHAACVDVCPVAAITKM